jgi:predicted DNA-binding protein YlxM (UPF0122 family)
MINLEELINKRIGRAVVLKFIEKRFGHTIWECICDCQRIFKCWNTRFKKGSLFECTHCTKERRIIDLTGKIFYRWTVIGRAPPDKRGKTQWHCRCECGIERIVADNSLKRPRHSMSCGCLGRKLKSKWVNPSLYPKQSFLTTSQNNFYQCRSMLIHKCYNPKHPSYKKFGKKGYNVCDLWRNDGRNMYEWAISHNWEESKVIILKEGKKQFNPENCIIITNEEFRSSIAKKQGIYISYNGRKRKLNELREEKNISKSGLRMRVKKYNVSYKKALEMPRKTWYFINNLTSNDLDKIKKIYKEGASLEEIKNEFGVSSNAISYLFKKFGIKKREFYDRSGISNNEIRNCLKSEMTISEIAKKYNVSWTCIKYRINSINNIKRIRN